MTDPARQPVIELVGGTEPSDELLVWLCDFLIDLIEGGENE